MFNFRNILSSDPSSIVKEPAENSGLNLKTLIACYPDVVVFALDYYRIKASSDDSKAASDSKTQALSKKNLYSECYDLIIIEIGRVIKQLPKETATKLLEATDQKSLEYFGSMNLEFIPFSIEKVREHHSAKTDTLLSEFLTHQSDIPIDKLYMYQSAFYMTGKVLTPAEVKILVFDRVDLLLKEQDTANIEKMIDEITNIFLVILCLPQRLIEKQIAVLSTEGNLSESKKIAKKIIIENIISYTCTENLISQKLTTAKKSLLLLTESLMKYEWAIVDLGLSLYLDMIDTGIELYKSDHVYWKTTPQQRPELLQMGTGKDKNTTAPIVFSHVDSKSMASAAEQVPREGHCTQSETGLTESQPDDNQKEKPASCKKEVAANTSPRTFFSTRRILGGGLSLIGGVSYSFGAVYAMTLGSALVAPYLAVVNRKGIAERLYSAFDDDYQESDDKIRLGAMKECLKNTVIQSSKSYDDFCSKIKPIIAQEINKYKLYTFTFPSKDSFKQERKFVALRSLIESRQLLRTQGYNPNA